MSKTVALVPGFGTSSARSWGDNGWVDLLADSGLTALPIDLLGHGSAEKPYDPAAYDEMKALVAAQLPDEPVDALRSSAGDGMLYAEWDGGAGVVFN